MQLDYMFLNRDLVPDSPYYGRLRNGMDDLEMAQQLKLAELPADIPMLVVWQRGQYNTKCAIMPIPPQLCSDHVKSVDGGLDVSELVWSRILEALDRLKGPDP